MGQHHSALMWVDLQVAWGAEGPGSRQSISIRQLPACHAGSCRVAFKQLVNRSRRLVTALLENGESEALLKLTVRRGHAGQELLLSGRVHGRSELCGGLSPGDVSLLSVLVSVERVDGRRRQFRRR